jgi:predicted O-methyltransferase YrrM
MSQIVPDAVHRYLRELNPHRTPLLREIARYGADHDLPLIDAEVGVLLAVLTRAVSARRVLEIGTAIGYSGIWIADALPPGGMLFTMEMDRERADLARENFRRAGVADRVSIIVGDARQTLAKTAGPFDLIFQDGDKPLYLTLLDRLIERLRPGGLLVTDNVLWDGEVIPGFVTDPKRNPEDTRAIAEYNRRLNAHPSLIVSTIPLRDGLAIAVKRDH